ncbi:hypothetical protein [Bartonella harrusi]|uniref:Uncharacterized protein n=1 Tax=Bartonella harrusi TaxID=2961895 RepID=A0ABY5EWJ9_9HYPH|nr:hypothetical protein [Bartonella harrusi]UTO28855.1 hypothetical protein NMK50_02295 [Bartonella harrusi]
MHENREMATQLLEEGFKYSDEAYKTLFIKKHPISVVARDKVARDKNCKIIYKKDANGEPLEDARGQKIPETRPLTDADKQHL